VVWMFLDIYNLNHPSLMEKRSILHFARRRPLVSEGEQYNSRKCTAGAQMRNRKN
jgi:hypothetical protein